MEHMPKEQLEDNPSAGGHLLELPPTSDFGRLSGQEALRLLEADRDGLSSSEARKRLELFGRNAIEEKRGNPLLEFLSRYWGPMPWLLELAMALSLALGHSLEAVIIFVLLTINAVIGFSHSRGSQKAVALLKSRLAVKAKALRDGVWALIDASELVPGDVLTVKLGDVVPADLKILDGHASVDESALTGESLPAERSQGETIYSGSTVNGGEARGVVVNTGARTYFGRTAELVKVAKPVSHQEEIMLAVVRDMMFVGVAASLLVAGYALYLHVGIVVIMTFVVIFLMGAVPVALPAVLTIVQSAAAMQLAEVGVLVARLDSIEDAASISVLCLDKTGTITQNKLSVADAVPCAGFTKADVLEAAAMASRAEGMDLIDLAVLDYAKAQGVDAASWKQLSYTPFDPSTRRTEAVVEAGGEHHKVVKGAAAALIDLCDTTSPEVLAEAHRRIDELAAKGYRTLAVARSAAGEITRLSLVGLLSLADPPRPDSKDMIAQMRALGVKPMMLTGDSLPIAREIAKQVGIGDNVVRFHDLAHLEAAEQAKRAAQCDGFAEIYPEDKFKIVSLLQSSGLMVGMTGDGVNDAPALKQAEMGIAVSNAADVAKASASVVLTKPGVSVIVEAIKRSRETYQRMLTWVINKVTKVVQVTGILTAGFFMLKGMALSLLDMSLLIFANDFVTMSLATDNVEHTSDPNHWHVGNITQASLIVGGLLVAQGVAAVVFGERVLGLDLPHLQSFMLLLLVFTSQFRVLIVRERGFFWDSMPGKTLLASTTATVIGFSLLGAHGLFIPALPWREVLECLAFSAVFTFAIDFPKYAAFRWLDL